MQNLEYTIRKEIKISNVVCTADLNHKVDILSFNKHRFLSSNLKAYKCGYVKDNIMFGKVVVFASGKLISVGSKSPDQAYHDLKRASQILKKYKFIKSFNIIPRIHNIVSSISLEKTINLNILSVMLPRSIYEPDQFSGIVYRTYGSIVCLIFATGKVIITGAKTLEELNHAYFDLMKKIQSMYHD